MLISLIKRIYKRIKNILGICLSLAKMRIQRMAKITIDDILASFASTTSINTRFNQIEDDLNDKVLYRDNPTGEANQMENALDMNENHIINLPQAILAGQAVEWSQWAAGSTNVAFTGTDREVQTATASQTLFTLAAVNYSVGAHNLAVYVNGVKQITPTNYAETSSTSVTFTSGLDAGDQVEFVVNERQVDTDLVPSTSVTHTATGTGAVQRTQSEINKDTISVKDFGAVGDGVTDDTVAIQAAIDYAKTLDGGGEVYLPAGDYSVSSLDMSNATSVWTKSVILKGEGRFATTISANTASAIVVDMIGSNYYEISNLTIDSTAVASQCAILLARTAAAPNANNNKFTDVWITGSYTKAGVVSLAAESTTWTRCRFENSNTAARHTTFYTCYDNSSIAVTSGNGTPSLGPNTDNTMFSCEFYAPYVDTDLVHFEYGAGYRLFGCSLIGGTSNNMRLALYTIDSTDIFHGPVEWYGAHYEWFGTGGAAHYVDVTTGTDSFVNGLSSYGGYFVGGSGANNFIDTDRTDITKHLWLNNSTVTTPKGTTGAGIYNIYVYALSSCNIAFQPNENSGRVSVLGAITGDSIIQATYKHLCNPTNRTEDIYGTAVPATGTLSLGATVHDVSPVVGQPLGWTVTVAGTQGTLNSGATTGGITNATNTLTVNATTGMEIGQYISIAGVTGPLRIWDITGLVVTLSANADATVAGAAVSFYNPTTVALANL